MRYSAGGAAKPQSKTPMPNRRHLVPRPAHRSPAELGYHCHRRTGERPLEAKLSAIAFGLCPTSPVAAHRSEKPRPKLDAKKSPLRSGQALSCAFRVNLAQSKEIVEDGTLLADEVE